MAETIKCTCVHPYQDQLYGKGNRIFTTSTKGIPIVDRCTVCGKTQPHKFSDKERGKKK